MKRINQMKANSEHMKELMHWRKNLRSNRAYNLREYRHYRKKFGEADRITGYMKGLAEGSKSPLRVMDYLIEKEDARSYE